MPLGEEAFESVLEACKTGAEWAWAALYRDLAGPVTGYLASRGSSEPEDTASEVFFKVARGIHGFNGDESSFRSWVFVIAHRTLLDERRAGGRRPALTELPRETETGSESGNVESEAVERLITEVASNGAAPGDLLYDLDRALEDFGIGDGGAAERIDEAQTLFNRGQIAEAVAHAAEAVEVTEIGGSEIEANIEAITSEEASEALGAAVFRLQGITDGGEEAIAVRNSVATLLDYMATTEHTGDDFGQEVANLARQISPAPVALPDTADEAADAGADNAENAAEESDDAPPEDVPSGPPDSVPPAGTPGLP